MTYGFCLFQLSHITECSLSVNKKKKNKVDFPLISVYYPVVAVK